MEAILGLAAQGPAVGVTVNGQPLATTLQQVCQAIKDQSEQLAQLRDYTYSTHQHQWERIAALEAAVSRLDDDVGISKRPVVSAGSTHGALLELEQRVNTLDMNRKGNALNFIAKARDRWLMKQTFDRLTKFNRLRKALRTMAAQSGQFLMRRFLRLWAQFRFHRVSVRNNARLVHGLRYSSTKRLLSLYMGKWTDFRARSIEQRQSNLAVRRNAATQMETIACRGFVRRMWMKWIGYVEVGRARAARQLIAEQLESASARAHCRRFYHAWRRAERLHSHRRRRNQMVAALAVQSSRVFCQVYFSDWLSVTKRRQRRLKAAGSVPHFHATACQKLAGRYFNKMIRYANRRAVQRSREEFDVMFIDMSRRCDSLSNQVEVGLESMRKTTGALGKLVERVYQIEDRVKATSNTANATSAAVAAVLQQGGGSGGRSSSAPLALNQKPAEIDDDGGGGYVLAAEHQNSPHRPMAGASGTAAYRQQFHAQGHDDAL